MTNGSTSTGLQTHELPSNSDLLINELWSELRDADARAAVLEFRNTNTPALEMLQSLSKDKRLIRAGGNELQVLHNAINRLQPKD